MRRSLAVWWLCAALTVLTCDAKPEVVSVVLLRTRRVGNTLGYVVRVFTGGADFTRGGPWTAVEVAATQGSTLLRKESVTAPTSVQSGGYGVWDTPVVILPGGANVTASWMGTSRWVVLPEPVDVRVVDSVRWEGELKFLSNGEEVTPESWLGTCEGSIGNAVSIQPGRTAMPSGYYRCEVYVVYHRVAMVISPALKFTIGSSAASATQPAATMVVLVAAALYKLTY